jgi:hypothetical protein
MRNGKSTMENGKCFSAGALPSENLLLALFLTCKFPVKK